MQVIRIFAWLGLGLSLYGLQTPARGEPSRFARLRVPEQVPERLSLVLAAELSESVEPGHTLLLSHAEIDDRAIVGQVDADGKRVWLAATLPERLAGKQIDLEATNVIVDDEVRIVETDQGFDFRDRGRPVLFYQREPLSQHGHTRAGFIHPLRGLDGQVMTESFPADHRHHQGVFWAWHQLWVGDRKIGDPWVCRDHLVVVRDFHITQGPLFATLEVRAEWTSPLLVDGSGDPRPIVEERTQIRLFRAVDAFQYVDLVIKLRALLPEVRLGGSEDVKGYSGFTVRTKPPMDIRIADAQGVHGEDAVQSSSPWADASGSFLDNQISGIAILAHPSLPQFPSRWVLRHYGMQNAAYPGREPLTIPRTEPLTLRYRLLLHRGDAERGRVAEHQHIHEATP